MKNTSILLVILMLIISRISFAQQLGSLDGDFDANGSVITSITSANDEAWSVAVQPDGKIIVTGKSGFTGFNSPSNYTTVRYNLDGSLDNSFGTNGIVTTDLGFKDRAHAIALQVDGKIVVGGTSNAATGQENFAMVRYNQDGTLDNTFIINQAGFFLGPLGYCTDIAIQSNGKIVAGGIAENSSRDFVVARYNEDGTMDSSFGTNGVVTTNFGGLDEFGLAIAIQADSKIVVAGSSDNGVDFDFAVARYNTDGSLDNSFSVNGMVAADFGIGDDYATSVVIQPDGEIVVAGKTPNEFQTVQVGALVRFNSNGTLDNSFGVNGKVIIPLEEGGNSVILLPDGKIVATAGFINFVLIRYREDGSLDTTFGQNGIVSETLGVSFCTATSCALQLDGKIVAAGFASLNPGQSDMDYAVARFISGSNLGVISFSKRDHGLLVYPNPLNENALIEYTLMQDETLSIDLFDISGNLVQSLIQAEKRTKGKHEERLNVDAYIPSGTYILTLSNGLGSSSIRVVKQ